MTNRAENRSGITKASLAFGLFLLAASPALAQIDTLRTPLVPGAEYADAYQAPYEGDPPPPGSGYGYVPVNPGMTGAPPPPASHVQVPLASPMEKDIINAALGGYLQPPPSTPGSDPGLLPPTNAGYVPPAAAVDLNPDGTMPGDQAPQQRWGGQTTRDLGRNIMNGSRLYDTGQKLIDKPDLAKFPQFSEDGPRPFETNLGPTTPRRQGQFSNAQQTSDLGIRTLFKGANLRAQQIQPQF